MTHDHPMILPNSPEWSTDSSMSNTPWRWYRGLASSTSTLRNNNTKMCTRLCLLALLIASAQAFAPVSLQSTTRALGVLAESAVDDLDAPKMNPNNPNLPELKGDFDWDKKFGGDDDWITENVPGKIVMNEIELAAQVTQLNKLEEKWRKQRQITEYDASRTTGWVPEAELLNGRFAMFFLVTGLLTELWTGVTMPGQVEELLRIGGFIGFD